MRNDEAFIRHALDRARRLTASLAPRGHWPLALAVAASLCVSAFGPPAAVHADPPPDPAARLQLFIKGVHIYDDRDWLGSGDLAWKAELCSIASPGLGGCNEYPPGAYQDMYGGDLGSDPVND